MSSNTLRTKGDAGIEDGTYVLVGCGQQKQDVDEPVSAEDLYTSNFFQLKKRYAEARSDDPDGSYGWTILSAKHGVLWPHIEKEPYDLTIDDIEDDPAPVEQDDYQDTAYPWDEPLYETRLDFWTRRVHFGLATWLNLKSAWPEKEPDRNRLIVLAGKDYVEPL